MVIVQIGGYGTTSLQFQKDETVSALLERVKEHENVSFVVVPIFQETNTGRAMSMDEIILDDRLYNLTVAIESNRRNA